VLFYHVLSISAFLLHVTKKARVNPRKANVFGLSFLLAFALKTKTRIMTPLSYQFQIDQKLSPNMIKIPVPSRLPTGSCSGIAASTFMWTRPITSHCSHDITTNIIPSPDFGGDGRELRSLCTFLHLATKATLYRPRTYG
jgi:hypothetical protein